jgi:hypothetical protein
LFIFSSRLIESRSDLEHDRTERTLLDYDFQPCGECLHGAATRASFNPKAR